MPDQYTEVIMKYLADRSYQPLKPRQLARQMGIGEEGYGTFRQAVKRLRDAGRIVMGSGNALMLPEMGSKVIGFFRQNPKGFGFVIPEQPNAHGDLFIPPDATGGAMTGDQVVARVKRTTRGRGRSLDGKRNIYSGQIIEIIQRGQNRFVGNLQKTGGMHFILPEGRNFNQPILLRDVGAAAPKLGTKVVVEIVSYGDADGVGKSKGELPSGVIVESLGPGGQLEVEMKAVIRSHGLTEEFGEEAMDCARAVVKAFDPDCLDHPREDVIALRIATIDPVDARDYDDAISLTQNDDGTVTLGVHIADVSHFVREGSPLDIEARQRSTSVYFPRHVLPMLPEILSNGVCSLQEGQKRLTKSAFITYDEDANVVASRLAETIIRSTKRLTYGQAQEICDGKKGSYDPTIVELVKDMEALARRIEKRRRKAGMLHLDLPAVELVLDENGKVVDARPEDDSYSHTIIEMFMVEANEAVARLLQGKGWAFLRRVHPEPDVASGGDLSAFIKACGQKLPAKMNRHDLQQLLEGVRGRPESYAVNLAVLKTFQQAEYSPLPIGHFALASKCYCHFTSPIRRYPDLTVHRLIADYCRAPGVDKPKEDFSELVELGEHCSTAERRASAAEDELREVLVLQLLETKIGDSFNGVITGVTNFGIFVQWPRFLCEGLIRLTDLGDDWWEVLPKLGLVRGEASGRAYRLGDMLEVRIVGVDAVRRQLNLLPVETSSKRSKKKTSKKKAKAKKPNARGRRKKRQH